MPNGDWSLRQRQEHRSSGGLHQACCRTSSMNSSRGQSLGAQSLCQAQESQQPAETVMEPGCRRRDRGLRERHVLLDLIGPMGEAGDIGEDAGVGGVSGV